MGYEVFDRKATKIGSPGLTITKAKTIALNPDAGDLVRRAGGKFVHFLWDASANKMALRPLAKADSIAFKLTNQSGKRRGMTVSAAAFLHHIGWNAAKSTAVAASWNEKDKALEALLPSKFIDLR
jgi:hypothetical protein